MLYDKQALGFVTMVYRTPEKAQDISDIALDTPIEDTMVSDDTGKNVKKSAGWPWWILLVAGYIYYKGN